MSMSGFGSGQTMDEAAGSSEAWCPDNRSVFPGSRLLLFLRAGHPVSAFALCLIKRFIGTRDDRLGRVPMVGKFRDTCADRDPAGRELLLRHTFPNPLSQLGCLLGTLARK